MILTPKPPTGRARYYSHAETKVPLSQRTVFTTGQIAKVCRVAARTVSKWIDSGELAGYRIPGSLDRRVNRDDLLDFLKRNGMKLHELEAPPPDVVYMIGQTDTESVTYASFAAAAGMPCRQFKGDWFGLGVEFGKGLPSVLVVDTNGGSDQALEFVRRVRGMEGVSQQDGRSVRKSGTVRQCHVVVLAAEDETNPRRFIVAGANAVVGKPVVAEHLTDAINLRKC